MQDFIFWLLASVCVISALGVVLLKDIFRSALLLVVVFLAIAGLFVMMNAEFLAVVQLLVYAGAVAILIIFAIMLTRDVQQASVPGRWYPVAIVLPALLLTVLTFAAIETDWNLISEQPAELQSNIAMIHSNTIGGVPDELRPDITGSQMSGLGELLTNDFVLGFEVAAVLLLAAIIGALVLVRERQ